jgi:exodeoxyribonuclease-3
VLALQELKMSDDKFPLAAFNEAGYQAQWFGQKTYNGVALISRHAGTDVLKNIPGFADEMSRVIAATYPDGQGGNLRVMGAYFPNGQAPDSDKFVYKMRWLTALHDWVKQELATHSQLILTGDFNITFDDLDVWDPMALKDTIHFTVEERTHLQALIDLGLTDSFRLFEQPEKSYSWWELPRFRIPAQSRLAHRPCLDQPNFEVPCHGLHRRQSPAQKRAPQRPCAGRLGFVLIFIFSWRRVWIRCRPPSD